MRVRNVAMAVLAVCGSVAVPGLTPLADAAGTAPLKRSTALAADAQSNRPSVALAVEKRYSAVVPARLLDTRPGRSTVDGESVGAGAVGPGATVTIQVTNRGGVPASGVDAVILNVTATDASASTFVTVYAADTTRPPTSNLNPKIGYTTPNMVVTKVSATGQITLFNNLGSTHLIVDVHGWFPTDSDFTAVTPKRLMDTRPTGATVDGLAQAGGALAAGATRNLDVVGRGGVPPTGVGSVVVNVTPVAPTTSTFLTVYPAGTTRPGTSSLNPSPALAAPNTVIAKVGADGEVTIYNRSGSVHVIVDVVGWLPVSNAFNPTTPSRLLDTRPTGVTIDAINQATGAVGPKGQIQLKVNGRGGVPPTGVGAIALNLTVTSPALPTYLTMYPKGTTRPNASVLNTRPGVVAANLVIAKVGVDGDVTIYNNSGSVHIIADVVGWLPAHITAVDDSATVAEDAAPTAVDLLGNDVAADGATLTIAATTSPAHGTVELTGGVAGARTGLSYEPAADYCGADSFAYTLNGGAVATVNVTINCVDDAPVAVDDTATVLEDTPQIIDVLANDTDVDAGPKAVASTTQPNDGAVVLDAGTGHPQYTPTADACNTPPGTSLDVFDYALNGGDTATVTVTVACVNDAPSFTGGSDQTVSPSAGAQTVESWATAIVAGPSNESGQTVSFNVTNDNNALFSTQPAIDAAGTLTFEPAVAATGSTSVTVTAVDDGGTANGGTDTSASSTFTITFNSIPVAETATVTIDEDAPGAILLIANDADDDDMTFAIATPPATGALGSIGAVTCAPAGLDCTSSVTFTPPANASGTFSFTYTANDGTSTSAPVTVTVEVTAVDDAPVAVADTATVVEDSAATSIDVLANDTDVDGGTKTVGSITQPANGTASFTSNSVSYVPSPDYCNNPPGTTPTTFTYTLNGASVGTVSVTVDCTDDLPVATSDAATVAEDSAATAIDVLANDTDADGGPISVVSVTQPAAGTVAITGGGTGVTYTPNANVCNSPPGTTLDLFTYTLNGASTTSVTVTVTCVDDPPTAVADAATVVEDAGATAVAVFDNDTDPDGGARSIASVTQPANGTVVITGGGSGLTYQPNPNSCNSPPGTTLDSFTYTLNGASSATVSMTVTCVNDAPSAVGDSFSGASRAIGNTALVVNDATDAAPDPAGPQKTVTGSIVANDTDVDGPGPLAIVAATVTSTDGAAVVIEADGDFTYHPKLATSCTDLSDSFTYTVSDGATPVAGTSSGTVSITIADCIWYVDAAGAAGDGSSAQPLNSLAALNGANDVDGDNATIFLYDGTYTGGLTLEAGQQLLAERHGLTVADGGAGTVTLVSAGAVASTISGGVVLGTNNALQGVDLGDAAIALSGTSFGTATINSVTSGAINNATGGAVSLSTGQVNASFTSVSSSGGANGILLSGVTGTFSASAGSITNATGTDVQLTGGTVGFTYGGSISDDVGQLVNVSGQTGGTKDFNGLITDLGGAAGGGISLTSNSGATIRFDGGLTLSTGPTNSFSATGGGTIVVTDPAAASNTIAATTGTPVTIASTTIGAEGVTLERVSATGAANGIVLSSTGNGFFSVTGAGGSCSSAANCTGGAIENTTGFGVSITTASDVFLDSMYIANTAASAVSATGMTDGANSANPTFTLARSRVVSAGDADNENALAFGTDAVAGNNTGRISIIDTIVSLYEEHGLSVHNTSGSLTVEVAGTPSGVTDSTTKFSDNHDTHGQGGILALAAGTSTITLNVTGVMFDNVESEAIMAQSRVATSVLNTTLRNNISINGGGPDNFPAGGGFALVGDVGAGLNFNVTGNNIRDAAGDGVVVIADGPTQGAIDNNVISGTVLGDGIRLDTDQLDVGGGGGNNFTATIAVRNNVIGSDAAFPGIGDDGIQVLHRDGTKTLNLTITGNAIANTSAANDGEAIRFFQDADISNGQGLTRSNVLINGNTISNAGSLNAIAFILQDTADADINVTSNTISGANLNISFSQAGTAVLQIVQASVAAAASANTGSTASSVGTITFNGPGSNPPLPVLP